MGRYLKHSVCTCDSCNMGIGALSDMHVRQQLQGLRVGKTQIPHGISRLIRLISLALGDQSPKQT